MFACTEACVSHRMEYRVLKSLLGYSTRPSTGSLERWDATAGKVAVGIRRPEGEKSSMLKICAWIDEGKPRDLETIILAKNMLRQDLASYQFVRHSESLGRMLQLALDLDETWEDTGQWQQSAAWKVLNALPMSFRSLEEMHERSPTDQGGFMPEASRERRKSRYVGLRPHKRLRRGSNLRRASEDLLRKASILPPHQRERSDQLASLKRRARVLRLRKRLEQDKFRVRTVRPTVRRVVRLREPNKSTKEGSEETWG